MAAVMFDPFLLANIFDADTVRSMINGMEKSTFSDGISIMGL
jgi:hypothetical protein